MSSHDDAADAVHRLYEEHPYPDHGVVGSTVARMALTVVGSRAPARILDAGCGTGEQTLGLARAFPEAEVVGVDLNDASLDRARHHGLTHGIDVKFARLDLLGPIPASLGRFDLITSVGVLHHLKEPAAGFTSLRALAAPTGHLLGMVYGRFGKHVMFAERDAIARLVGSESRARLAAAEARRRGYSDRVLGGLGELARRRQFGPALPVRELVRRAMAGRNRAFTADSYAHPQEVAFTWSDLDEVLTRTGWVLEGWPPRSGMPDGATQLFRGDVAARIDRLPLLDRASVFERLVRPANLYFRARPAGS